MGEAAIEVTVASWAFSVFSKVSEKAFQICIWPEEKPPRRG